MPRRWQEERLGKVKPLEIFKASQSPLLPPQTPDWVPKGTYQDVQAGGLQQGDLVRNGQAGEAWQTFSKLHDLNNALGGQFTEFVPEAQVQSDSMVSTGILRGRENTTVLGKPSGRRDTEHISCGCAGTSFLTRELPGGMAECCPGPLDI